MYKLKIFGLGRGKFIPSTKFRLIELKDDFKEQCIDIDLYIPQVSSYPPKKKLYRLWWGLRALFDRLPILFKQKDYDIVILQREMISTLYTLERFISKPFIFDVDDAIHLHQRFGSIDKIAMKASAIVVCNTFLAEYYKKYNDNVYIIPTPVNIKKYCPSYQYESKKSVIIGWIGTSSNFKSLYLIEKALNELMSNNDNVKLKIVSNEKPEFTYIDSKQYIFKNWSEKDDVKDIQSFDIGIMPLIDNEHSKGKCAFKMLQYMACGVPVVSTCLPMNQQILNLRDAGFCVNGYENEWIQALQHLIENIDKRLECGKNGVKIIEKHYSTKIYVQKYINIFNRINK